MEKNDEPSSLVEIYPTKDNVIIILLKGSSSVSYFLYTVNRFTGSVSFYPISGTSFFPTHKDAVKYINDTYQVIKSEVKRGVALIGVAKFGPIIYIPIVKKTKLVAKILNYHNIYEIKDVEFFSMKIPFGEVLDPTAERRVNRIIEFPFADLHFYCETCDLTSPLWKNEMNKSFVWNEFWAKPFMDLGYRDACITLLQGITTSDVLNFDGTLVKITMITIREAANGGTRYFARGLNKDGYAGNEVQCELVVETCDGKVWSTVWRRGTAPILWRSIFSKNLPKVSHVVDDNYDKYTKIYFDRLTKDYEKVICIDLLHNLKSVNKEEADICSSFSNAVSKTDNILHIEYDWHTHVKESGLSSSATELLSIFNPFISYSEGDGILHKPCLKKEYRKNISSFLYGNELQCMVTAKHFKDIQNCIFRINCLDSLDRTNVACFFYAAKSLSFILSQINICQTVSNFEDIMNLPLSIRTFLAKSFINIGDTISLIYTNTTACMKDVFIEVAQMDQKVASNSNISVQRRYHNMVTDRKRNKILSLFTGKMFDVYLPGIETTPIPHILSSYPASIFPENLLCDGKQISSSYLFSSFQYPIKFTFIDSFMILLNEYSYVSQIILVLAPPFSPISCRISCSLTHGQKIVLVNKVALPQVSTITPVLIKIPNDYSNIMNLSRYIVIEFETINTQITLSNIYIFGNKMQLFDPQPEIFRDTSDLLKFEDIVRNIDKSKIDYCTVLSLEAARLSNHKSHIEAFSQLLLNGLNPLFFKYFLLKNQKKCGNVECESAATVTCSICKRGFCEACSKPTENKDEYICNGCQENKAEVLKLQDQIVYLNQIFFKQNCEESSTNIFLNVRKKLLETAFDPTVFPYAFFPATDNPFYNLVLTEEGGQINGPQNLYLALGSKMILKHIEIESSDDCSLSFFDEFQNKLFDIPIDKKYIDCDLPGQFFYLKIMNGCLYKLKMIGITKRDQIEKMSNFKISKPTIGKEIRSKQVIANNQQHSLIEMSKLKKVKGICFKELNNVSSMIISFYKDKDAISEIKCFFIPEGSPNFVLRFSNEIETKIIRIIYYDVNQPFIEPKVTLF